MAETCSSCKYEVSNFCQRFPPTLVAPNVQMWPVVDSDDWCGEWASSSSSPTTPTLTSLSPNTLVHGTTPTTVDLYGTNFDSSCVVLADGQARATFYIDNAHLQATARPDLQTSPSVVQITVQSPTNGTSDALPFTYT